MSAVKVIRALLVADAAVLALLPAVRIIAGVLPQGTTLPAVAITEVSTIETGRIDAQAPTTLAEGRVQVTVIAASYPAQKQLLDAVRKACNYERGSIAGVPVVSVRRGGNGPDFNDPDNGFYMQSVDFRVTYHEAN
jgi:hypothetical protein